MFYSSRHYVVFHEFAQYQLKKIRQVIFDQRLSVIVDISGRIVMLYAAIANDALVNIRNDVDIFLDNGVCCQDYCAGKVLYERQRSRKQNTEYVAKHRKDWENWSKDHGCHFEGQLGQSGKR